MSETSWRPYLPATDMPRFLRELAEFVGLTDADVAAIRLSAPHSLARWLRETAQAALTHEHAYYLLTIGLSHSHRAHGPGGVIPVHFMVGAMSLAQSALADAFAAELGPAAALEASVAWNKLLLVHLAA